MIIYLTVLVTVWAVFSGFVLYSGLNDACNNDMPPFVWFVAPALIAAIYIIGLPFWLVKWVFTGEPYFAEFFDYSALK